MPSELFERVREKCRKPGKEPVWLVTPEWRQLRDELRLLPWGLVDVTWSTEAHTFDDWPFYILGRKVCRLPMISEGRVSDD